MTADMTSRVFVMHGVVDQPDRMIFGHRNLSDRSRLLEHLRSRDNKYVDLEQALAGRGSALTIDDATVAAGDASLLAREHGHAVTLFINPGIVVQEEGHFFSQLNALLDEAKPYLIEGLGLASFEERLALRRSIKARLLRAQNAEERRTMIEALARDWKVKGYVELPEYLKTLSLSALDHLVKCGVRIGNHSWTHGNLSAMPIKKAINEIECARAWIDRRYGERSRTLAVPFGHFSARLCHLVQHQTTFLLSTDAFQVGRLSEWFYNRQTLKFGRGLHR